MLLDRQFNIHFIRVENWVKAIKKVRKIDDESYLREVFQTIEKSVRDELLHKDSITFESTGLTKYFDQMLENLCDDFIVVFTRLAVTQNGGGPRLPENYIGMRQDLDWFLTRYGFSKNHPLFLNLML